jgi:hypothetical protein
MSEPGWMRACALLVGLGFGFGPASVAGQTVDGRLLESGTDRPVELGLLVLLTESGDSVASTLTDQMGRFRLESPEPGIFLLAATALGYEGLTAGVLELGEGARMSVNVRIRARAIEIAGITVETRASAVSEPTLVRNGFVDRAQRGFGSFITPKDIFESGAATVSDLLSRTGRVTTRYARGGDRILMRGSGGYCTPAVFVDGVRVSMGDGLSLDLYVQVSMLAAVEVYRSSSEAPLQYGGGLGGCGVLVLWTRAG